MSQSALKLALGRGRQQDPHGEKASEPFSTEEVAHLQGPWSNNSARSAAQRKARTTQRLLRSGAQSYGPRAVDVRQRAAPRRLQQGVRRYLSPARRAGPPRHAVRSKFCAITCAARRARRPRKETASAWIKDHVARLQQTGHREEIQNLSDGRIIRVTYEPLAGGGWVDMQEDITAQRQSDEKIEWLARHDTLTEIPNRFHFRERLEHQFETYDPRQGFALLWLDLDHFKEINDRLRPPRRRRPSEERRCAPEEQSARRRRGRPARRR